jgi:hypothetical protein
VTGGDLAVLTIVYDSEDPAVPGFGVRVHYDGSKLALEQTELLWPADSQGVQDQPDEGNADGDALTDRRLLAVWLSFGAGWPGADVSLPLPLLRLHFRTQPGEVSTQINLSGDTCALCTFEGEPAQIHVSGGGPTYTPTATATSTPTRTATPTATFGPSPTPEVPGVGAPPPGGPAPTPSPDSPDRAFAPAIPTVSGLGAAVVSIVLAGAALVLLRRRS